jgi:hypothetical protein
MYKELINRIVKEYYRRIENSENSENSERDILLQIITELLTSITESVIEQIDSQEEVTRL